MTCAAVHVLITTPKPRGKSIREQIDPQTLRMSTSGKIEAPKIHQGLENNEKTELITLNNVIIVSLKCFHSKAITAV